MPEHEAIATTKRKFYKALDNITNPPAIPSSDHQAKRVRRSISGSSSIVPQRQTSSRTTLTARSTTKTAGSPPKPIPNFSPWSHETFISRLKSFSRVSLWHPKPEAVSEVEWAKRGWVCVDVNTVACKGGCERRVVVSLDAPKKAHEEDAEDAEDEERDDGTYEDALVERYKQLIVDGHAETCLWRKAGCKDDIYHMQVVRPSVWQPELSKRYQLLQQIDKSIKDVQVQTLPREASSITSERLFEELPANMLGGSGTEGAASPPSSKALDIALHGWHGACESSNDLLRCEACFQRVGLWMYQPGYRPSHSASEDDTEDESIINLLEMHRDHCPWRNPNTQRASGSLAGLNAVQILHRVIATYAREQRRRSGEQQRTAQGPTREGEDEEDATPASPVVSLSRDEIERQDKERDTRLQKLKRLFTIKRKSAPPGTLRPPVLPVTSANTLGAKLGHRLSRS